MTCTNYTFDRSRFRHIDQPDCGCTCTCILITYPCTSKYNMTNYRTIRSISPSLSASPLLSLSPPLRPPYTFMALTWVSADRCSCAFNTPWACGGSACGNYLVLLSGGLVHGLVHSEASAGRFLPGLPGQGVAGPANPPMLRSETVESLGTTAVMSPAGGKAAVAPPPSPAPSSKSTASAYADGSYWKTQVCILACDHL